MRISTFASALAGKPADSNRLLAPGVVRQASSVLVRFDGVLFSSSVKTSWRPPKGGSPAHALDGSAPRLSAELCAAQRARADGK